MTQMEEYIRQIEEEKKRIDSTFIKYGYQAQMKFDVTVNPGFTEDTVITIIAFIFTTIASGFLKEIGKEIWIKIKEAGKRIIRHHKEIHAHYITEIRLQFQLNPSDVKTFYILKYYEDEHQENTNDYTSIFYDTVFEKADSMILEYSQNMMDCNDIVLLEFKRDNQNKEYGWVSSKFKDIDK